MLLRIVMRVIARRMEAGEGLETILLSYPRLTEPEKEVIRAQLAPEAPEEG